MKKQYVVAVAVVALIAVFAVAAKLYKSDRAEKLETMAQAGDSPLLRAHSQTLGPADAKVVIVEFFDPACETCATFGPPVKGMVHANEGKIRLVMRYAPFHHGSDKIVMVLEAARLQGKYWETLQMLFETQQHWASHQAPNPELIWHFLPTLGLDIDRLKKDMNSPEILNIVQQDLADAKTLGVRQTPEFFVNGKPLPSFGFEQLQTLVAQELAANY